MVTKKSTSRDKSTGRYKHTWAFINGGGDKGELGQCQDCGMIKLYYGNGKERTFKTAAAARKAGIDIGEEYE